MHCSLDIPGERLFSGHKIPEMRMTPGVLQTFVGRYRHDEIDTTYTLALDQDDLVLRVRERAPVKLLPFARDSFEAGPLSIIFSHDASDAVTGFAIYTQAARGVEFTRAH